MIDCKCSFVMTLITEEFGCEKAQLVTHRAGPDITCSSEQGSGRCQQVYTELKAVGLHAFDVEDDLLKTPASVFAKIQFGGLLGLGRNLSEFSDGLNIDAVDNIYQLLDRMITRYEIFSNIPFQQLVDSMTTFKLKRKKRTAG